MNNVVLIFVINVDSPAKSASFTCSLCTKRPTICQNLVKMEMPIDPPAFFVAADWLAEHIDDPEIQILDARMAPPGQEDRDVGEEYRAGHIPGAVFFDIEALSDHTSPLPHMMPRPESLRCRDARIGCSSG